MSIQNHVVNKLHIICIYIMKNKIMSVVGRWFSPGTPVSSSNETDRHDINEILFHIE